MAGGASTDRFVVSVAVQVAAVVLGMQVAGLPRAVVPFMNCTVPVGAVVAPALPVTVAVSVTLPPAAIDVALEVIVVVVFTGLLVTVTVVALESDPA